MKQAAIRRWGWLIGPLVIGWSVAPAGAYEANVELIAEDLTAPLALVELPDGSGRKLILEQIGRILLLDAKGVILEKPFLDFRHRLDPTIELGFDERGALGLAPHPRFAENGLLYLYYSAPLRKNHELLEVGWGTHTSHIVELKVSEQDPNQADPDYERMILQIDQPQFAHNGGTVTFGPDGKLFISLGDGGSAPENKGYPPEGTSQLPGSLLGKILRIDVDQQGEGETAYGIPSDNPFVGQEAYRPEIFAMGFRNPYRIAFDADGSGRLFAGDVGQNAYEEIDLVLAGANYGWAIKEGRHCFNWEDFEGHLESCKDEGLIDPIIAYRNGSAHPDQSEGRSTVGGTVYRGTALPDLVGKLIFADWSLDGAEPNGVIYVGTEGADSLAPWNYEPLVIKNGFRGFILSLSQDVSNELYILTNGSPGPEGRTGKIFKLVP